MDGNNDRFMVVFEKYIEETQKESDRGSVLVQVSLLDDILTQLIKIRLIPSLDRDDELFEVSYAPFSSFSAKIDLAYRIGIITQSKRRSLHILRKIRNNFAHATDIKGFDSDSTHDRIRELLKINKNITSTYEDYAIKKFPDEIKCFNDMIKKHGWRYILELVFAGIAADLSNLTDQLEPIEPLD